MNIQTKEQFKEAIGLKLQYEKLQKQMVTFTEKLGFISYSHDPERLLIKLIEEYKPTTQHNKGNE